MNNKIDRMLIATGNRGKLSEISELLKQLNIDAIGSFEYNLEEPEENGLDFFENSLIKSKYYAQKTGLISLADDSGLCVDLLNKEPGIHSARWAINKKNQQKDFPAAFEKIKQRLVEKGVDIQSDQVKAHFICNLSIYNPKNEKTQSFEGRIDGELTFPPRGEKGFGYDPIFIPNDCDKTFGEMENSQKEQMSHRSKAFDKLVTWYLRDINII